MVSLYENLLSKTNLLYRQWLSGPAWPLFNRPFSWQRLVQWHHEIFHVRPTKANYLIHANLLCSYDNGRLFSRNLEDLLQMTPTLGIISLEVNLPQKIIYPVDLHPILNESQQRLVDEFISTLEEFMRVKVEEVNLGEMWAESRPVESRGEGMQTYMKDVSACSVSPKSRLTIKAPFHSWCYEYYHAFDDFRDRYRERFHRNPFVEATPQFLWYVWR